MVRIFRDPVDGFDHCRLHHDPRGSDLLLLVLVHKVMRRKIIESYGCDIVDAPGAATDAVIPLLQEFVHHFHYSFVVGVPYTNVHYCLAIVPGYYEKSY